MREPELGILLGREDDCLRLVSGQLDFLADANPLDLSVDDARRRMSSRVVQIGANRKRRPFCNPPSSFEVTNGWRNETSPLVVR